MSRRKYADRRRAGRSATVPFVPGEDASSRHWRRKGVALDMLGEVRAWCHSHGVNVCPRNEGHHWTFTWCTGERRPDALYERSKRVVHVAEWWPSSAKLIFQKLWRDGVHCHDWPQVRRELVKRWNLQE